MKYIQLTREERYMICALRMARLSQAQIARQLGRSESAISRELARNRCADGGYRGFKAQRRTNGRRRRSRRNSRFTAAQYARVESLVREKWRDRKSTRLNSSH